MTVQPDANQVSLHQVFQRKPDQDSSEEGQRPKGQRPTRRLDCIDAARGIACLWVLLHHTFFNMPVPAGGWHYPLRMLVLVSNIGWLGVSLFLVLSGFCLFYPLASRYHLDSIRLDVAKFAARRAWRILPPYYAALLLLAALELVSYWHHTRHWAWDAALHGPKDVGFHLFMLHNLSSKTIGSVSGAFWSLALECQLYLVFPLLVWFVVRFGLRSILAVTFLIAVIWQGWCFHHLGSSTRWTTTFAVYYQALPGRCFEFAAGMAAASFVARPRLHQSRVAFATILALLPPALYLVWMVWRFGLLSDQIWGVIFASLLVLSCRLPNVRFERGPVLRILVWLGTISYSVYLMHVPFIGILSPQLMHCPANLFGNFIAGFLRLPILIGIGYLFHLTFERPFMSSPGRPGPKTERQAEVAAVVNPAP